MVNIKERASNAILTVKRKALPVAASAATAISALTVSASAAEGGTTSMYNTIAEAFGTAATGMADGIALVFAAVIPIGIGIIGMYACVGAGKRIMTKLTG